MGLERYSIFDSTTYIKHFNSIKDWFEENAPTFFSNIVVNEVTEDSTLGTSIDFYDNINGVETLVFKFATEKTYNNWSYDHARLRIHSYISGGTVDNLSTYGISNGNDVSTYGASSSLPEYFNAVSEITKIRENIIGLSLYNNTEKSKVKYRPSILIFAKTHKERIALIKPSINFSNTDPFTGYVNGNRISANNYIQVLTYNTTGTTNLLYTYGRSGETMASFNDLPVSGDDDYVPNVFYLPTTLVRLQDNSDSTIHIKYYKYYYNGVIAVELIDD